MKTLLVKFREGSRADKFVYELAGEAFSYSHFMFWNGPTGVQLVEIHFGEANTDKQKNAILDKADWFQSYSKTWSK